MADSAAIRRFLVLWTIFCTLYQTPEIQATTAIITRVTPSVSANASSPSPGPSSSFLATPWISSINVFPSSSAGQLVQSTQFIGSDAATSSQPANENTIAPTPSQITSSSQTASTASASVITAAPTPTPTPTPTDSETDAELSTTEIILIACLAVFACIFLAVIVLVVQIIRLNKSVKNLKATGQR
ncbi:hypothetical protein OS493_030315 [Desmophyllum pertusum]|uniref:Uncharacterized protein n=1 Tax=Desmophyllum pertusum TaxID=174260 RepID=A0A9W9ZK18_9CNID|nr:hypothetical protein OS493_030315 [Desmophyllum pertusum]